MSAGELLELIDAFQFFQPIDPELVDKGSVAPGVYRRWLLPLCIPVRGIMN